MTYGVPISLEVGLLFSLSLPVASRVQLAALKVPVPSLVQLTVPVGMFAPLPLVTVAVQAVELSTATEGGGQLPLVAVARRPMASSGLAARGACLAAPPELPVILWVPVPTAVGV